MNGKLIKIFDEDAIECGIIWTDHLKIKNTDIEKVYEEMQTFENKQADPDLTIDNLIDWLSGKYKENEFKIVFTTDVNVEELY